VAAGSARGKYEDGKVCDVGAEHLCVDSSRTFEVPGMECSVWSYQVT